VTRSFPRDEQFGLTSQLKRACASIPANIANGCGRSSKRAFARHLDMALGSAIKTQHYLMLAHDLGCVGLDDYPDLDSRITAVKRSLRSLIARIHGSLQDQTTNPMMIGGKGNNA
jgi:four helix bundle protein